MLICPDWFKWLMKKTIFTTILTAVFITGQVLAAETTKAQWLTSYPDAQAKAKAENKLLLVDFTGSDWCPPCIQLNKTVFSSPEFEQFASNNVVLLEVDFPRTKTQSAEQKTANQALQKQFNVEGYPTVIVFNSNGKQVSRDMGYGGESASEYVAKLQKLKNQP